MEQLKFRLRMSAGVFKSNNKLDNKVVFRYSKFTLIDSFDCSENGTRPTLVFDLMGIVVILSLSGTEVLCGGRHLVYRELFESLLTRLAAVADLVFFEDGPSVVDKLDTIMKRRNNAYDIGISIIDQVYEGKKLEEIVEDSKGVLIVSTVAMIEETAKKFGKLIVTVTKECDAELARYANNNPSVLAVMADDSDFLIFSGRWRYFSLNNIEHEHLTTLEYNRLALREFLDLNDKQLMILSTLGGNDIIKIDEVRPFHNRNKARKPEEKFRFLAKFIKRLPMDFYPLLNVIAGEVLHSNRPETKNRIEASLKQYSTVSLIDKKKVNLHFIIFIFRNLTSKITAFVIPFCIYARRDITIFHLIY